MTFEDNGAASEVIAALGAVSEVQVRDVVARALGPFGLAGKRVEG